MFKNYFKIALRNLAKNKSHSLINIGGLAVGLAVFMLITIYTQHELSYNRFHKKAYRIFQFAVDDGFYMKAPLATQIKNSLTGFENIVRVDQWYGGGQNPYLVINDGQINKKLKIKNIRFAEQSFFEIFDFKIIHGNPNTALAEPYSIVLTKSTTLALFGIENPVGRTIHYLGDNWNHTKCDMIVTAIVEDVPGNSTITFNALGSLATLYAERPMGVDLDQDWGNNAYLTFVLFKDQNVKDFEGKANTLWEKLEKTIHPNESYTKFKLVPLTEVPFYNNNKRQLIYFIQLVGIFILSIAIVNFVNLTIAKSTSRMKEIGIRKVVGSHRLDLIKQFLFEAIIICVLVTPLALLIVELSKQQLFHLINKQIPINFINQPFLILLVVLGIMIIAMVAGIYPAVVLSSFKTTFILKNKIANVNKGISLKQMLIVFQFVITISLFIGMLFISKQVTFLKTADLGFSQKNIIHFQQSQPIAEKYEVFKQKLLQNPNIISVSRCNGSLARNLSIGTSHEVNGVLKPYSATTVDPDFISTMGIELLEGRPFSWDKPTDEYRTIIVNESFVKEFELKPALGAEINFLNWKATVIGVMKDFHYNSLREKIGPGALVYANWNATINIKINGQNVSQAIRYTKNVWDELSPEIPFEYEFLDQTYNQLYKSEESLQRIIILFSGIAMIIACLGLFGLISYSAERRTKEIGVRKVVGASVKQIVVLLSKDFAKLVLLASLIACPIAWFAMNKWLENFAYHTNITFWPFLLAGLSVLVIASLTVSWQAIRAATANPVEALRYE
jgi:putative ABC transport system permease protein